MNVFATILAFALFGQGTATEGIIPEGMDYNQYLDTQFKPEFVFDMSEMTDLFEDKVVIYNAAGELVAEGNVEFIGGVVDTQNTELSQLLNSSDYMMEMDNTRIYRLR